MKQLLAIVAVALLATLLAVSSASAEGTSIASATPTQPGVSQSGNVANGPINTPCHGVTGPAQGVFWSVPLMADDFVVVRRHNAMATQLNVFGPGVTDATLISSEPLESDSIGDTDFGAAAGSGNYILEFCSSPDSAGEYSFSVSVRHYAQLVVPGKKLDFSRTNKLPLQGTLPVQVRNSEGLITDPTLSVSLRAGTGHQRDFKIIGGPVTNSNGMLRIHYKAPKSFKRMGTVSLDGVVTGDGYRNGGFLHGYSYSVKFR